MEVWEVVGVDTNHQITIKAENKTIKGIRLFLIGDAPDNSGRYRGRQCREQFISNERLAALNVQPLPGDIITMYFNRFGDIAKIEIAAR